MMLQNHRIDTAIQRLRLIVHVPPDRQNRKPATSSWRSAGRRCCAPPPRLPCSPVSRSRPRCLHLDGKIGPKILLLVLHPQSRGSPVEGTAHRKGRKWTPRDPLHRRLTRLSQVGGGWLFRCDLRGNGVDASSCGSP